MAFIQILHFGPAEQALAFTLLLIEQEAQSSHQPPQSEAAFTQSLQAAYRRACAAGQFHASVKNTFLFRRGKAWLRLTPADAYHQALHVFRLPLAEDNSLNSATERLLRQLYWLNAGLLI